MASTIWSSISRLFVSSLIFCIAIRRDCRTGGLLPPSEPASSTIDISSPSTFGFLFGRRVLGSVNLNDRTVSLHVGGFPLGGLGSFVVQLLTILTILGRGLFRFTVRGSIFLRGDTIVFVCLGRLFFAVLLRYFRSVNGSTIGFNGSFFGGCRILCRIGRRYLWRRLVRFDLFLSGGDRGLFTAGRENKLSVSESAHTE
uniref:Secreted protein n=1 Tax=Anopheles culicifacies TaxID=139723 RepID=A0A182LZ56_9DIPT